MTHGPTGASRPSGMNRECLRMARPGSRIVNLPRATQVVVRRRRVRAVHCGGATGRTGTHRKAAAHRCIRHRGTHGVQGKRSPTEAGRTPRNCCQLIHYPDGSIVEAPIAEWRMGVFVRRCATRAIGPIARRSVSCAGVSGRPCGRGLPTRPITRCQHERHSSERSLNRRRRSGRTRCAARSSSAIRACWC